MILPPISGLYWLMLSRNSKVLEQKERCLRNARVILDVIIDNNVP